MNPKINTPIYVIEPHPDDALGSASGLLYSKNAQITVCTLTQTGDDRDHIDLTQPITNKALRMPLSVTAQKKYHLEDLHWDLRLDIHAFYQTAASAYYHLYGDKRIQKLKCALMEILTEAVAREAQIGFPLGLIHPMHIIVREQMIQCIRETSFPADRLWIYVDHPYDIYCIGTNRMADCTNTLWEQLGEPLRRYDCLDVDQQAAGEALRMIYGDVHHAEFSDAFRRTFCSFYITENRKRQSPFLRLKRNSVLFITAQSLPFYKTGGLGDVAYGFVQGAVNYADQIRIMMLLQQECDESQLPGRQMALHEFVYPSCRGEDIPGRLRVYEYHGIIFYLIDAPRLLMLKPEPRYGILADMIIRQILPILDYKPDILHCNDWHTGFIPFLLKTKYRHYLQKANYKILYTIHSYGYQGICNKEDILRTVGLDKDTCSLCPVCMPNCPLERITYLGSERQICLCSVW